MHRTYPGFLLLLVCLFGAACASSHAGQEVAKTEEEVHITQLEQMAAARYGTEAPVTYLPNKAETHMLVVHQAAKTPQQPLDRVSYFIYALAEEQVVMEEQAIQGTVAWKDNQHVQVRLTPGNVPAQGSATTGYLIDVTTGTRMAE